VIVPDKTKAKDELLINNNDLKCLDFSDCHEDYTFERDTNRLYSRISSAERQVKKKE
jgi:hypothetical protein